MRVYFAAPLFDDAERRYNEHVCEMLEDDGHSVFLPQRDGFEGTDAVFDREGVETQADALDAIFRLDRRELLASDVSTAVLDGRVPDEGVAVEMGIAHEHDVPVVGLKTGRRVFAEDEPINAMLHGVLDELVKTPEALLGVLNEYDR